MTTITSALRIVVRRCAMMIVVRFSKANSFSIASCTTSSDSESRAEVASSNSNSLGFPINTRAMAILCFCPPESCDPLSPT
mmetsp:Transcript_3973/g.8828  ORF Transcript_3973/g.8828 Transcript_3973/m.8828 type:complete len:81 (-) Transcript_3973:2090-2332(-)